MIERLTADELHGCFMRKIAAAKPFSAIRCGDGEYEILKESTTPERVLERITRWFPVTGENDVTKIQRLLMKAYEDCDMLGIPSKYCMDRWGRYHGFDNWLMRKSLFNSTRIFFYDNDLPAFEAEGRFVNLVRGLRFVGLLTCRDLKDKFRDRFKVLQVEQIRVAGEQFKYKPTAFVPGFDEPHWPDGFARVKTLIKSKDRTGELWIVGAGGLAKPYCQFIKEQGGMAIDVGALFDGWAGVDTRPTFQDTERYQL